jgi:PhnB protein
MAESWSLTPYLVVEDACRAVEFYQAAFGAREMFRQNTPDGTKIVHSELDINGARLMLSDNFGQDGVAGGNGRIILHLDVPAVDAAVAKAVGAGARISMPVADMFWGARYGKIEDPFGLVWSLSTQLREPTPEEMRAGVEAWFGKA